MKNVIYEEGKPIARICKICKVQKPYDKKYFQSKNGSRDGGYWLRTECRECMKVMTKNKDIAVKNADRKMPNNCECCGRAREKSPKGFKKLCADHIHGTTQFRGWICQACNKGIGMTVDDPDIGFVKIAEYYRKNDPDKYKQMKEYFLEDK
jgi:hypothetical protein